MPSVLLEYADVVRNLERFEMTTFGEERSDLGLVAVGISRFLRRQPWTGEAQRHAGFALAERANEVAQRCGASSRPRGQA